MFQFDSGTYSQTLAHYGDSILTVDGNVTAGISFIINRFGFGCATTPTFSNDAAVLSWINGIAPGSADWNTWMSAAAACYNGCVPPRCDQSSEAENYLASTNALLSALGVSYWYPPGQRTQLLVCRAFPVTNSRLRRHHRRARLARRPRRFSWLSLRQRRDDLRAQRERDRPPGL